VYFVGDILIYNNLYGDASRDSRVCVLGLMQTSLANAERTTTDNVSPPIDAIKRVGRKVDKAITSGLRRNTMIAAHMLRSEGAGVLQAALRVALYRYH
jgi:hypothetical protein